MEDEKSKEKDPITEFIEEEYSDEIEEIKEKASMSHDDGNKEDGESLLTQSDEEQILFNIEQHTNNDGTVDVTIEDFDISESEDQWYEWTNTTHIQVQVHFSFPNGETDVEVMELPRASNTTNKFPLLVKSFGYKLSQAEQIKGKQIKYDPESEQLKPDIPLKLKVMQMILKIKRLPENLVERTKNTERSNTIVFAMIYIVYILAGVSYLFSPEFWYATYLTACVSSLLVILMHIFVGDI